MRKNKSKQNIITATEKGYKVVNGVVLNRDGKQVAVNLTQGKFKYKRFSIRSHSGERVVILVHRLVAFQKFGKKTFKKGLQVRHLDSDSLNNSFENIALGTPQENQGDKPMEVRLRSALIATSHVKKYDHKMIIKLRESGLTYKKIMEITGIKNKSVISFIINKSNDLKKIGVVT